MNARTAKKVVARYVGLPHSYSPDVVKTAHRIVGKPIQTADWDSYTAAREAKAAEQKAAAEKAQALAGTAKRRREENLARLAQQRAERDAVRQRKEAERIAAEAAAAAKEEVIEDLPKETVVQVGAVEAKIEAGDDGVIGTDDDEVTIQKAGTALSEMSVAELKAEAKSRGLSGYSKLKKDELLDLLSDS